MKIMFQCYAAISYRDWCAGHTFEDSKEFPIGRPFESIDEAKKNFSAAFGQWHDHTPFDRSQGPEIQSLFIRPILVEVEDTPLWLY